MSFSYRDILYRDYARHFGNLKLFGAGREASVYPTTYRDLPEDRSVRIADLGCGRGEWLGWLKSRGFTDLTGFEYSEDQAIAAAAATGTVIHHGEAVAALREHEAAFDLIHAKDLIEHLTKDEMIDLLHAARGALKPGGSIWLLSFNAQAPLAAATRYGDFTHEMGYTPLSLAQVLGATGYSNVTVRGVFNGSGSVRSRIRQVFYRGLTLPSELLVSLRHGRGTANSSISAGCMLPDLFATGSKP